MPKVSEYKIWHTLTNKLARVDSGSKGKDIIKQYTTVLAALSIAVGLMSISAHAATITVTSNADSGTGSLRAAITTASGTPAADTINIDIAGGGPHPSQ